MLAVYNIRQEAVDTAQKAQTTYICGPLPPNYDKVKVYIAVSDATPSEIAIGVRERLRSLADVEVVYTPIEADVGIGVLGFENTLEGGHRSGYSASVITYDPCKGAVGERDWPIRIAENHFMVTTATVPEVINSIVSDVDTGDLEGARKLHAAIKKAAAPK